VECFNIIIITEPNLINIEVTQSE